MEYCDTIIGQKSNVLFLLKSPCISVSVRSGSHDLAKLATVLLSDKECDVKLKILEDLILTKFIKWHEKKAIYSFQVRFCGTVHKYYFMLH